MAMGCWFINGPHSCEACNHSSIFGSLVVGLLYKESLGNLLLLGQDHGADLLRDECLGPLASVHLFVELGRLLYRLEKTEFDVILYSLVRPIVTDHPLGVNHGVLKVGGQLVLG